MLLVRERAHYNKFILKFREILKGKLQWGNYSNDLKADGDHNIRNH
jgi:hypothetical protein